MVPGEGLARPPVKFQIAAPPAGEGFSIKLSHEPAKNEVTK